MCVLCEGGHDPSTGAIIANQIQSGPPEWHQRELARLADGTYKPIPNLPEFTAVTFRYEHFLHLSQSAGDLDMIAFTASHDKGKADRQTPMKFGRYLKQYYPGLTDEQIKTMVDAMKIHRTEGGLPELRFATDRETISWIFETPMAPKDGAYHSCMYNKFYGWINRPYHVYADSPDVAVAYIQDDDGKPLARSVVSTKDKGWVRLYGHLDDRCSSDDVSAKNEHCRKLAKLLSMAGYEQKSLAGNRLTVLDQRYGQDVLPYIDGDDKWVREKGGYWLVYSIGDIECDSTEGLYGKDEDEDEDEDYCNDCDSSPCECIYCDCCEQSYCGGCDDCQICEQCCRCHTHDGCSCSRCSECRELISTRHSWMSRCDCDRCSDCGELDEDCECQNEDEDEVVKLPAMFVHDNPPTFVRLDNTDGLLMPVIASFKYAGHIFLVHHMGPAYKLGYYADCYELTATYGPLGLRAANGNTVEEVIADMSRHSDSFIQQSIRSSMELHASQYCPLLGPEEGIVF
jgi:hypothetical protein